VTLLHIEFDSFFNILCMYNITCVTSYTELISMQFIVVTAVATEREYSVYPSCRKI